MPKKYCQGVEESGADTYSQLLLVVPASRFLCFFICNHVRVVNKSGEQEW
jgi:hypothetical protein